jgi:transcriptional regulator with XRE-family HTH domain
MWHGGASTCHIGQMELAAQQFLRALRGRRSQRAFARRLGYRGNPLTDWEHGRRYPTARETLRAAARVKVDVCAAFARFAPSAALGRDRNGFATGEWLRAVSAPASITELAERSGLSRFAIGRWLSGKRHPRLPDFFRLVDVATGRLPDLVAELVPIAEVPALAQRHRVALAARRIAFDEPWTEAILRVLETPEYARRRAHRAGLIAERLGISLDQEVRSLSLLQTAEVIRRRGNRYAEVRPFTVDTRGGQRALYAIKQHWARVASERAADPRCGDVFAYNVLSASKDDLARIAELLHTTFREIRTIVAASEPADRVALLNLQLVGWNGEPHVSAEHATEGADRGSG